MLDFYKSYYGLTGEPFRLWPDHSFSLHHESYAKARAYLKYGIYQGEGFIVITGGPGTGKTTLISEILSDLDRDKVHVATLISTQLESRDLLHMVASSFGLKLDDVSKGNLLIEIEAFVVNKAREGKRSILIVDEAQGLSPEALGELRLLANLHYQNKLVLQIFLVGQEHLLELIRAPDMEPLRQRMVAATQLKPLSIDETVDYIEHRLHKVGWKDDPTIDEGALREIYRYSGGVPRRINLIVDRLFLRGALEKKRQFDTDDMNIVILEMVGELLLDAEPLISETDFAAAVSDPGEEGRPRRLPREDRASAEVTAEEVTPEPVTPPEPAVSEDSAEVDTPAPPEPEPVPEFIPTPDVLSAPDSLPVPKKSNIGKGIAAAVFLLAGAGLAYLLIEPAGDQLAESAAENLPPREISDPGNIVRKQSLEPVTTVGKPEPPAEEAPLAELPPADVEAAEVVTTAGGGMAKPVIQAAPVTQDAHDDSTSPVETVAKLQNEVQAEKPGEVDKVSPPPVAEAHGDEVESRPLAPVKPAKTVERVAKAETVVTTPFATSIEARRLRLKQAAEQRLLARQAKEKADATARAKAKARAKVEPVVTKPQKQVVATPASETTPIVASVEPLPVKIIQRLTPDEMISVLLDGRWSSHGKPASLLPSGKTYCSNQAGRINCVSIPQNIKTQFGLALYKVETTLSGFSPQGHFEMSYQTLVKLVDSDMTEPDEWQVKDYSMSCTLTGTDQVACVDDKGVSREYRKTGLVRKVK